VTWVYNLYYTPSLRYMKERGFLNGIGDSLPDTREIRHIIAQATRYVEGRLHIN
jgi:hypothetical protein